MKALAAIAAFIAVGVGTSGLAIAQGTGGDSILISPVVTHVGPGTFEPRVVVRVTGTLPTGARGLAGGSPCKTWYSAKQDYDADGTERPEGFVTLFIECHYTTPDGASVNSWDFAWVPLRDAIEDELPGLIDTATGRLELPELHVAFAPGATTEAPTFAQFPTWIWAVDPGPQSASASHPLGAEVTATGTASSLVFDPGDGAGPIPCDGLGIAWTSGMSDGAGECTWVPESASWWQPDELFHGTARVTWEVAWVCEPSCGSGDAGQDSLTTPVTTYVSEIQALETTGGGSLSALEGTGG